MKIKAYAKINIALDVTGKRSDGYHLLKMIMQQIDLYDVIEIKKIDKGIIIDCNKPYLPKDSRNIAYKAAELFLNTYNINSGISIDITKNIPVAAGLAGGSSNAAAVLKALRNLFKVEVSNKELCKLGLKLGADVPYCIIGGTALCSGIGEVITPITKFDNKILIVVKPSFGVSTKRVYGDLDISKIHKNPRIDKVIKAIERDNVIEVCYYMKNVLENVTVKKYPEILKIKKLMENYGAMGTLMSGSGPTVFGIFNDMLVAQNAFLKFKDRYNETFITRTL